MAYQTLRIDTGPLSEAHSALGTIAYEFKSDTNIANNIGDAVGHAKLQEAVEHLSTSWRIRRGRILDDINALTQILGSAAKGFEDAEQGLTDAMTKAPGGDS